MANELVRLVDSLPEELERQQLLGMIRHLAALPREMFSRALQSVMSSSRAAENGGQRVEETMLKHASDGHPSSAGCATNVVLPLSPTPPPPPPPPPPHLLLQKLPTLVHPAPLVSTFSAKKFSLDGGNNGTIGTPDIADHPTDCAQKCQQSTGSTAAVAARPPPPPPAPPTAAAVIPRSLRPRTLPEQGRRLRHFQWAKVPANTVVVPVVASAIDNGDGTMNIWQKMDAVDREMRKSLLPKCGDWECQFARGSVFAANRRSAGLCCAGQPFRVPLLPATEWLRHIERAKVNDAGRKRTTRGRPAREQIAKRAWRQCGHDFVTGSETQSECVPFPLPSTNFHANKLVLSRR